MPPADTRDVDIQSIETVYRGYVRVDTYRLRHRRFDGGWMPPMTRELMERGHAAVMLPYDPARETVVLCEQFRIGAHVAGMDRWQMEAVAGIIGSGETPEGVCIREAQEEAGLAVTDLFSVQRALSSPGCLTESMHFFVGRVESAGAGGIHGLAEEGEHIRVHAVKEADFAAMLESGRITNLPTLFLGLWFLRNRDKVRAKWSTP